MTAPAEGRVTDAGTAGGDRRRETLPAAMPRSNERITAAVATAALAALLVFLALTPLPPFASHPYTALRDRHLVLSVLMIAYLGWLIFRRRLPRRTPYDLGLVALTAAVGLAVVRSATPRLGLEAVLPLLPSLVLLYALYDTARLDGRALARATVLASAIVALVALVQVGRVYADWLALVRAVEGNVSWATLLPPSVPRVAGVGNHSNILASLFAMALPAVMLLWTEERGWAARAGLLTGAAVIVAALFFTLARAAWLAAAVGMVVTGVGMLWSNRVLAVRPSRRLMLGAGAAVVLGVALVGGVALSGARPQWLFRDSLSPRADMRRAGWEMWRDNPLTGVGPGRFVELYPLYNGAYPFAAVHTHNIVVQTAADLGVAGAGASLLLLGSVGLVAGRAFAHGDADQRRMAAAALGMLAAFLVHGLADAPQLFPEAQAWAIVALVLLARAAPSPGLDRARNGAAARSAWSGRGVTRIAGPALAVLVAAMLPALWLWTDRAHAEHAASVRAAGAGRWPEAVAAAERAVQRDSRMPAYWYQLGAAHAGAAVEGERTAEQRAALAATQRGLELDAHNGAATVNWAALNVALGNPERARESTAALGRLAGRDTLLLLAHATLVQWTMPPEAAVEQYAGLVAINPTLAGTPFWQDGGFRQANFDRIVERAKERAGELAATPAQVDGLRKAIDLYAGRAAPSASEVRLAVALRPDDVGLRVAAARVLMAAPETVAEAGPLLRGAVERRGDDRLARAALGDWYALNGDVMRARRQWMTALALGDPGAAVSLGESYAPGSVPRPIVRRTEDLLAGAEIERFYLLFQTFRFAHLRAEPVPIVLPGDWLAALPSELAEWRASAAGWR